MNGACLYPILSFIFTSFLMKDSNFTLARITKTHTYFTPPKDDLFLKNNNLNQATCGTYWHTDAEVQNLHLHTLANQRKWEYSLYYYSQTIQFILSFPLKRNKICAGIYFNFSTAGVWNSSAAAVHLSTTVNAAELQPLWGVREATSHHIVQSNILHLSHCKPKPPCLSHSTF